MREGDEFFRSSKEGPGASTVPPCRRRKAARRALRGMRRAPGMSTLGFRALAEPYTSQTGPRGLPGVGGYRIHRL